MLEYIAKFFSHPLSLTSEIPCQDPKILQAISNKNNRLKRRPVSMLAAIPLKQVDIVQERSIEKASSTSRMLL